MQYQHLARAGLGGTDADGGYIKLSGELGGQRLGYSLHDDKASAGFLHGQRISLQLFCGLLIFALNAVASQLIDRLRCQANVGARSEERRVGIEAREHSAWTGKKT